MSSPTVSHLPADLFTSRDLFTDVLRHGWLMISDHKKNELLSKFMPESLDPDEKGESVEMLLSDDLTKFDMNPIDSVYMHLKISKLAPDINKTLEDVKRLKHKAQRLKEKENQMILWKEILTRRKDLLGISINCSPDDGMRAKRKHPSDKSFLMTEKIRKRADKRFKQELKQLNSMTVITSDDDEDLSIHSDDLDDLYYESVAAKTELPFLPNGLKMKLDQKKWHDRRSRQLISDYKRKHKCKIMPSKNVVTNHADKNDPIFSDQLNQIISRVGGASDDMIILTSPPFSPLSAKKKRSSQSVVRKKSSSAKVQSSSSSSLKLNSKDTHSPENESKPILPGIELMSRKLDLNLNSLKKEKKSTDVFDFDDDSPLESLAPEAIPVPSVVSSLVTQSPIVPKIEPIPASQQVQQIQHQAHLSSQIPHQQLPTVTAKMIQQPQPLQRQPQLSNHINSHQVAQALHIQPHQMQTSHMHQQQIQVQAFLPNQQNSASDSLMQPVVQSHVKTKTPPPVVYDEPPASFFSLIRDVFRLHSQPDFKLTLHKLEELVKDRLRTINPSLGWNHESVQSAMNFLSYFTDPNPDVDSIPLVDYKEKNQQWQWIGQDRDSDDVLTLMCKEWLNEKDRNSSVIDPSQPIPPAAWPTEWTVKPSTDEERKVYREQEAIRYNNPNKAFTYRIHSYESVVGPVKGCGVGVTVNTPPAQSPNKAREHNLLVSDRPPFVTLLSLVRDAAARLPNGEGTRADICELLKDSQYLLPTVSDQQINSIVSGALDRLHYEKDPCVKYDVNRKVWIYLHRNRSESDFERLHEMQIAAAKAKKNLSKNQKKPARPALVSPPTVTSPKQIQQKKPLTDNSIVTPITSTGQTRISISPLVQTQQNQNQDTDKTILNILNQVQASGPPIFPKKKLVKEVQIVHNIRTHDDDASVTSTVASVVRPITANNVVSMIPVSSLPSGNRLIASADSKDKVQRLIQQNSNSNLQPLQKLTSKTAISVLPARPQNSFSGEDNKRNITVSIPNTHSKVQQPVVRQVPVQQVTAQPITTQTISIQPQGTQITVPSSVIFGTRGHQQVVLGGKSYMMTSQNGGQIVLQPQTTGTITTNQASIVTGGQQPLRLQGIKVISVPSNGPRVLLPQQGQSVVARILTRPGLQAIQPVILTQAQASTSSTQGQVVQQQLVSIQPQVPPTKPVP